MGSAARTASQIRNRWPPSQRQGIPFQPLSPETFEKECELLLSADLVIEGMFAISSQTKQYCQGE
jgi:hypothetical protein